MDLPVMPPVMPMLAKAAKGLPPTGDFLFEPKWDGFRCIAFRHGDEVELGSRNEKPLTRYFPEVVEAVKANFPDRAVMDGEIVIAADDGLDFGALLQRIHPADSRVRRLAAETPASFVAFDLLALGDRDLQGEPFTARRAALAEVLAATRAPVHLTPCTDDREVATDWFHRFEGAGLDGVIAKPAGLAYKPGERAMVKVKHERTADCAVVGFRWHKSGPIVGSLVLGLHDEDGLLHHVGVTASFTMQRRKELVDELAPYRTEKVEWADARQGFDGRAPQAHSRWNAGRDLSFEPLRLELVCEVAYDHMEGQRFRHAATFRRWRPDREPSSCTYAQLDTAVPEELATVFGAG